MFYIELRDLKKAKNIKDKGGCPYLMRSDLYFLTKPETKKREYSYYCLESLSNPSLGSVSAGLSLLMKVKPITRNHVVIVK